MLLTVRKGIARQRHVPWAQRLAAQLHRCLNTALAPRVLGSEIGEVGNNAALIAAHRGRPALARTLCELQMKWQLRLSERAGIPELAANAVQPWVNLARLRVLSGEWQAPSACFAQLYHGLSAGLIELEAGQVGCTGWTSPETTAEFTSFVHYVYIVDSLRALLMANRYDEVLEFAEARGTEPHFESMAIPIEEARIAALAGNGHQDAGQEAAAKAAGNASGWERMAFRIRLAEVRALAGDVAGAQAVLQPLARVVQSLSPQKHADLQTLCVTSRIAAACFDMGLHEAAAGVARHVCLGARTAGDEVFELDALRLLAAAAPPEERPEWAHAQSTLITSTGYAKYLGEPAGEEPIVDGLMHAVLDALSN